MGPKAGEAAGGGGREGPRRSGRGLSWKGPFQARFRSQGAEERPWDSLESWVWGPPQPLPQHHRPMLAGRGLPSLAMA